MKYVLSFKTTLLIILTATIFFGWHSFSFAQYGGGSSGGGLPKLRAECEASYKDVVVGEKVTFFADIINDRDAYGEITVFWNGDEFSSDLSGDKIEFTFDTPGRKEVYFSIEDNNRFVDKIRCPILEVFESQDEVKKEGFKFLNDIRFGETHSDIKKLQEVLNKQGIIIADDGPGSPGNETDYFGSFTKDALYEYQKQNDIDGNGDFLNSETRAYLNGYVSDTDFNSGEENKDQADTKNMEERISEIVNLLTLIGIPINIDLISILVILGII